MYVYSFVWISFSGTPRDYIDPNTALNKFNDLKNL